MNWIKYFTLGSTVFSTVLVLVPLVKAPGPLDGTKLLAVVEPALVAVEAAFPQVKIPTELATEICFGIAEIVNKYYKKGA